MSRIKLLLVLTPVVLVFVAAGIGFRVSTQSKYEMRCGCAVEPYMRDEKGNWIRLDPVKNPTEYKRAMEVLG